MFEIKREVVGNTIDILINGKFTDEHQKAANNFFELYEFDKIIFHENQGKLIPKALRKCRFCGQSSPIVTFKNVAHTIPQLMGNSKIINDFECDACNDLFSQYENELANFMGLSRTLTFLKGQKGLPTYKSPDKKLIVEQDKSSKRKIRIIDQGVEESVFKYDKENKTLIFNSIRHPYTPIKVFKILLKIGYSFLDEEELDDYKDISKILQTDKFDDKLKTHSYLRLFGYFCPGIPFASPLIIRYTKRVENIEKNCPNQGYLLYFQNYIYQFFMPFCEKDKWMFDNVEKEIEFNLMPPLLDKRWIAYFGKPNYYNVDLSSNEIKINDPQVIHMKFEQSTLNPQDGTNAS